MYISIIIPAYNEEFRIGKTFQDISNYLNYKDYEYELIVVDDGSKDKTLDVINSYSNKFKNLKILNNEVNRGKGFSVKRGMLSAKGDLRLFMDADDSVKIENLDRFIENIKSGDDIVIGSIEIGKTLMKDNNYWYRRILGKMSKILIRMIAVPGIYDTQRGFKLFTKRASELVFPFQTIDRWGFDIELLTIAQKRGLKIKEIAVEWINAPGSTVNLLSYLKTFVELLKIKKNSLGKKYD